MSWLILWWEKKKIWQVLPRALNPNHEQFSIGCVDLEASWRNTEQTLMELDDSTSVFQSCGSNNLPIIFTHWRTYSKTDNKYCYQKKLTNLQNGKTIINNRHIQKSTICAWNTYISEEKSSWLLEAYSLHERFNLASFNLNPNPTRKMFDAKP